MDGLPIILYHSCATQLPAVITEATRCKAIHLHMCILCFVLQSITYNKQLREQIDNLRRERLMFEAINSNLDKELARIKRNIAGE